MNHFKINELPQSLQAFIRPLLRNVSTDSPSLRNFIKEAGFMGSGYCAPIWDTYEIKLLNEWEGYKAIRFHIHTKQHAASSKSAEKALLMLKKSAGGYDVIVLETSQHKTLEMLFEGFSSHKKLTSGLEARWTIEKSSWDGLKIYTENQHVQQFYYVQNIATAQSLLKKIKQSTANSPIYVVDLGCGTGTIFRQFLQLSKNDSELARVNWIGVDFSQENINQANQTFCDQTSRSRWIQSDALAFVKRLAETPDLYVVASGLLTFGVLTLEESVLIVQHLRELPRLKCLALTGLHDSCISPYMAKQMGFERCDMSAETTFKRSVEGFTPVTAEAQKQRILNKAKKYKTLDLSFLPNLTLMKDLTSDDLKDIEWVVLAGVPLDNQTMTLLNQWIEMNPRLLFICAGLSNYQAERSYFNIVTSKNRCKFILQGTMEVAPVYSPHFFDRLDSSKEHRLPFDQSNSVYQSILLKRLFIALNNDHTVENEGLISAKKDIHKLINKKAIYTENELTTDEFLATMKKTGISGPLLEALEDYIRIIPIECFTAQEYWDPDYHRNFRCGDRSEAAHQTALKLKSQGVFNESEWAQIEDRFTNPRFKNNKMVM